MKPEYDDLLKSRMSEASYGKLAALENKKLYDFVGFYAEHSNPKSIYMCDDSAEDEAYVRTMSLQKGEERPLSKAEQTIHYDGSGDQARDRANTKYLVYAENLARMEALNSVEYEEGYQEILGISKNIMDGKDAVVKLFCEGPAFSEFTRPCVQFSDSWYVAHSEQILYRKAYSHFAQMKEKDDFFRFIHSAGNLDDRGCTVDIDKRRVYMDTQNNIVYSMNAQYAGNSVGLKKHSMRLAINQAGEQGWLCEHMFVMAAINKPKNRKTYFCGAFPSACGKTSTAMIPGEQVVGDDIAYFRNIGGEFRAVNVEQGIFGIIKDVNEKDDPVIYANLMKPQEMIFSNVLTGQDNEPYWINMGVQAPKSGENHSGADWSEGKINAKGAVIPIAHPNSRYTMRLDYLQNFDRAGFEDKRGVAVQGLLYGGRDSDTTVPVEESKSYEDGIIIKAATLESETTSATIGQEGVRRIDPMANLDFISYRLGEYVMNNLKFVESMQTTPKIYSTNYFLLDTSGNFATSKLAKKVWLHWAEGRVHDDFEAYETPTGFIPRYEDLAPLFRELIDEQYSETGYTWQFSFRCDSWIAKLNRVIEWYRKMDPSTPKRLFDSWEQKIADVEKAKAKYGATIKPGDYTGI